MDTIGLKIGLIGGFEREAPCRGTYGNRGKQVKTHLKITCGTEIYLLKNGEQWFI